MKAILMPCAGLALIVAATASAQQAPFGPPQANDAYRVIQRIARDIAGAGGRPEPVVQERPPERTTDFYALIDRLADEMGKEFIVSPYFSPSAIGWSTHSDDADFETLQGLLRAAQYTTIETADQVFILPDATSRAEPSMILNEDDRRVSDHTVVTRVIEVENVPTAQLIPILRPMMPQSAQLTAVQGTTSLVMVDHYDNVRRLTEIIKEIDEAYTPPPAAQAND
jgi:hypothetical protein